MTNNAANESRGLPPARRQASGWWRCLVALLCLPALLSVTTAGVRAVPGESELVTSHAYAVFGDIKYPADFDHFDFVNPDAPKGGTYRFAFIGSFDSLNLMNLLGTAPLGLVSVYDTLMHRSGDEAGVRYPLVAESITYPKDLAWMDFHLNPRARWHDGKPITPEDIIYTIDQSRGLVAATLKRVDNAVERAEKTGPHTVRVWFTQKNNPTLPSTVMDMWLLPKHYYSSRNLAAATLEPPLGSGPYKVRGLNAGRWIEFERVKDYWAKDLPTNRGRFNFDILRHDYYRDATIANEAFFSGNSDLRSETSAVRWANEEALPAFRAGEIKRETIPYSNTAFYMGMVMNTRRPALADRALRKALLQVYDYEWVKRVVLAGHHGRLLNQFPNGAFESSGLPTGGELALLETVRDQVPPELFTTPHSLPVGGTWDNRRANLIEATRILREAGYKFENGRLLNKQTGEPMELELVAYTPLMDKQVSLFIENARQIGIAINFRSFDSAQFRHRLSNYDFDLLAGPPQFAGSEAPSNGTWLMWGSQAADVPGQLNYAGVKNPAVDAMIGTMVDATDRETVVDSMKALDRILLWNYYSIPFQHNYPAPIGEMPITYWDRFGKPATQPLYYFSFSMLDTWWTDPAKSAQLTYGQAR